LFHTKCLLRLKLIRVLFSKFELKVRLSENLSPNQHRSFPVLTRKPISHQRCHLYHNVMIVIRIENILKSIFQSPSTGGIGFCQMTRTKRPYSPQALSTLPGRGRMARHNWHHKPVQRHYAALGKSSQDYCTITTLLLKITAALLHNFDIITTDYIGITTPLLQHYNTITAYYYIITSPLQQQYYILPSNCCINTFYYYDNTTYYLPLLLS
jgi:hypothetical protein